MTALAPRILFVSSHAQLGGSELSLLRLIERLDPNAVHGLVLLQDGEFATALRSGGHDHTIVPTGASPLEIARAALRMRRTLRALRPDVVHANGVKAALVMVLASAGSRRPVVWVKHDFSWDGTLANLVGRRCSRIVGVSRAVLETFRGKAGRRTIVVHNGIPTPERHGGEARLKVVDLVGASDAKVISIVGRLHPYKGHADLLHALVRVRKRVPRVVLLVVGGTDPSVPSHPEALKKLANELGLEDRVYFAGYVAEVGPVIEGSDVVAIPTRTDAEGFGREGFGLVGVEAMALGCPVVGYAEGALPEVLGRCARLVPVGDVDALARGLEDVLTDEAARARLVDCGMHLARERYSIDRMVAEMTSVYSTMASR